MKLGVAVLSHNRPELLKVALSSFYFADFDDVVISDNSEPSCIAAVDDICRKFPYLRFFRTKEQGLTANLINLVGAMSDDVAYILLCDDDELHVEASEIFESRNNDVLPIARAKQPGVAGWRNEPNGRLVVRNRVIHYSIWFPNLGFAGSFVPASIYRSCLGHFNSLGPEFDILMLSEFIMRCDNIAILERSHYKFNVHSGQISQAIDCGDLIRRAHVFFRLSVRSGNFLISSLYIRALLYGCRTQLKRKILNIWRRPRNGSE